MLEQYEVHDIDKTLYTLLTQKGDELLDYKEAVDKLDGCVQVLEDGGNHSFDKVQKHFEMIRNIFTKNIK